MKLPDEQKQIKNACFYPLLVSALRIYYKVPKHGPSEHRTDGDNVPGNNYLSGTINHCLKEQGINMNEDYEYVKTSSCTIDLPSPEQVGWKLVGFNLVYGEDGPASVYRWARRQKPEEEKVLINGGAPQELWARCFDFEERDYNDAPVQNKLNPWMAVFTDTITYPVDRGANRDEAPKKTETRVIWTRIKTPG